MNKNKCGCGNCGNCCKGKKGPPGATGATGATGGSANSQFLLKFSGISGTPTAGDSALTFLADPGVSGIFPILVAPKYPVGLPTRFFGLSVNLPQVAVPPGATVDITLLQNGSPIPGATVSYGGVNPISGPQTLIFATPVSFISNDQFDLLVTTTGPVPLAISISASVIAAM